VSHREWAWLGFVIALIVSVRALDPDPTGSAEAPHVAIPMLLATVGFGLWLVFDHVHHHHHHHR
jgi:hypothetical protein